MTDLAYQLTPVVTIGIVRDPTPSRLLKISTKGSEVLGNDEVNELLACILEVVRIRKRKNNFYSHRFRNHVPVHIRVDPDVKSFMGRLERTLREGKETVED